MLTKIRKENFVYNPEKCEYVVSRVDGKEIFRNQREMRYDTYEEAIEYAKETERRYKNVQLHHVQVALDGAVEDNRISEKTAEDLYNMMNNKMKTPPGSFWHAQSVLKNRGYNTLVSIILHLAN